VSLSTAIVFGLAFSKLITLGLVPAMLALPYRVRERFGSMAAFYLWLLLWPARFVRRFRGERDLAPEAQPAE